MIPILLKSTYSPLCMMLKHSEELYNQENTIIISKYYEIILLFKPIYLECLQYLVRDKKSIITNMDKI